MKKPEIIKFEQVIPYLNYELKASFYDGAPELVIGIDVVEETIEGLDFGASDLDEGFRPILHPLSMLTQEIEHDGEKFVPIEVIEWRLNILPHTDHNGIGLWMCGSQRADASLDNFNKLFEWHFNVFNLPEELYIKKS